MQEKKKDGKEKLDIPEAETTAEGIIQQGAGVLTKEVYEPGKVYKDEKKEQLHKEITEKRKEKVKHTPKDLSTDEWFNLLVHRLAQDYEKPYNRIKNFSFKYDDLKLPDGTAVKSLSADEAVKKIKKEKHVEILLDASGSMAAEVPGGKKMKLAKKALKEFAENMPDGAKVSLRVFGHKGTGSDKDKNKSCKSSKMFYPLKKYNEKKFSDAMTKFNPSGWTPLALAMKQAKKDLKKKNEDNTENLVYIVSDGIETCGGDPVAAAKSLNQSGIKATVNIIGFDVDDKGQRQLKDAADAGDGQYQTVHSKKELEDQVENRWGWVTWALWQNGEMTNNYVDSVHFNNQLRRRSNDFTKIKDRDRKLLTEAAKDLQEKDRIDIDKESKIMEKIDHRIETMENQANEISDEKHDAIFDQADKLENIIDKLAEKHDG